MRLIVINHLTGLISIYRSRLSNKIKEDFTICFI